MIRKRGRAFRINCKRVKRFTRIVGSIGLQWLKESILKADFAEVL